MSKKIILIGWNENAKNYLYELIENNFKPKHIFLPINFDTEEIKSIADKEKIPYSYVDRKLTSLLEYIEKNKSDLLISASCPFLLPEKMLTQFSLGVINIHAAFLPELRGVHPINWALLYDLSYTGVTIHFISPGVDDGDIIIQKKIPITNKDTASTIRHKVTTIGAKLLIKAIKKLEKNNFYPIKQDSLNATYAPKRFEKDAQIKWKENTRRIFNLIRSQSLPYYPPSFSFNKNGERVKIIKSYIGNSPGKVLGKYKSYYLIETGDGIICVKTDKTLIIGEILTDEQK